MYSNVSGQVDQTLANRLQAMPKVEIHIHLEGATDAQTIYQMAQCNNFSLPAASLEEWKLFYEFRDFNHFVEVYAIASRCMQTPEDFALMTEQFLQNQSQQNIRYSEAYFSPALHFGKLTDEEILNALMVGAATGEAKYGSRVKFIVDISRQYPHLQTKVLEFALQGKEKGIVIGLGIGGPEVGYPPENYTKTFAQARTQGLRVVAHAGETEGRSSIWGAINSLQAERIGHGVRCLEDASLVTKLCQKQTPLEVSPQSNYCLGVVKRDEPHPIRQMINVGLLCTLNSDDPPMFSTNLNNEYLTLAAQGFSWEELWQLNLNTLEATFLPETEKSVYRTQWQAFLQNTGVVDTLRSDHQGDRPWRALRAIAHATRKPNYRVTSINIP
ncbi:MAG: adenosine deaminase [Iphinoe sp. HA4291-MV1]|nr:adenosine deaminase [Iphinoe sp. HA4291-MV1]